MLRRPNDKYAGEYRKCFCALLHDPKMTDLKQGLALFRACDDGSRTWVLPKRHTNALNDGAVPTVHTVFCTPKISIQFENNDSRGVVAMHPIKCGEVLLVEHCQVNSLNVLLNTVMNHASWFNELWPRPNSHWSYEAVRSGALVQYADEKICSNAFHTDIDDMCMLGRTISAFNHEDRPNTALLPFYITEPGIEAPTTIIACVAIRDIAVESAVTIQYGDEPTTIHPYIGEDGKGRVNCPESPLATRLVEDYLETAEYQRVIRHQECAHRGLYNVDLDRTDKGGGMNRTPRYMEYLAQFGHNDIDTTVARHFACMNQKIRESVLW